MKTETKKNLKKDYQERKVTGGIYVIKCNEKSWLKSAKDIRGAKNRFDFAVRTKLCPEAGMQSDWKKYGPEAFSFELMETLEKGELQSQAEFSEDIQLLYTIWSEKREAEKRTLN